MSPRPMRCVENQAEPSAKWDFAPTVSRIECLLLTDSTTTLKTPVALTGNPSTQSRVTGTLQKRSHSLNSTQRAWVSLGSIIGGIVVVVVVWCCCCRPTTKRRRRRSKRTSTTLSTTQPSSLSDEISYRGSPPPVVYPYIPPPVVYPNRPPPVVTRPPRTRSPDSPRILTPEPRENRPQRPQNNPPNETRPPNFTTSASNRNTEVDANDNGDTPVADGPTQPPQNDANNIDGDGTTGRAQDNAQNGGTSGNRTGATGSTSGAGEAIGDTPANAEADQNETNTSDEDSGDSVSGTSTSQNSGNNTDKGSLASGDDTDGDNEGSGSERSDGRRSARNTPPLDERNGVNGTPSGHDDNPQVVIVSPPRSPNAATQGGNAPNIVQADPVDRQQPEIRLPRQYGHGSNAQGLDLPRQYGHGSNASGLDVPRDYNQRSGPYAGNYPQGYVYGQQPGGLHQDGYRPNAQGLNVPLNYNEGPGQNAGYYPQGYDYRQHLQGNGGYPPRFQGDVYSPPHSIVGGPTHSVRTGRRQRPQPNHPELRAFLTGNRGKLKSNDR